MAGYVYIVTNHKHGTLYIGVTCDLERRIYEHREALTPGFTSKYGCKQLVWYEEFWNIQDAIQREKSLKRWYRKWKIDLIEKMNPDWRDLYLNCGEGGLPQKRRPKPPPSPSHKDQTGRRRSRPSPPCRSAVPSA